MLYDMNMRLVYVYFSCILYIYSLLVYNINGRLLCFKLSESICLFMFIGVYVIGMKRN